jgi:hypothetical protein
MQMHPPDFGDSAGPTAMMRKLASKQSNASGNEPLCRSSPMRLPDIFHRSLMSGGMPAAVNTFPAVSNIDSVRDVQQDLHSLCRLAIAKRAPFDLRLTIREIYGLTPGQALSKTRRFNLGSTKGIKRFAQVDPVSLACAGRRFCCPCASWMHHATRRCLIIRLSPDARPDPCLKEGTCACAFDQPRHS